MANFDDFEFPRVPETSMRLNPVLPLVYDDALSYYEGLMKCIARINEITDLVNSFDVNEAFIQQSKDYTDKVLAEALANINNRFSQIDITINSLRELHIKDIGELRTLIVSEVNRLQAEMTRLYQAMKDFNVTVDYKMEQVRQELLEFIKQQIIEIEAIYVTSPVTGKWVPIQTALYDLYNLIVSFWSITAGEYDSLELTAGEYDSLGLTAYQYDNLARWYLWDYFKGRMISPFTGKWVRYDVIINQLADLHKNALTAGEYDAIGLTAIEYQNFGLTAFQYDWNGKELLYKPTTITTQPVPTITLMEGDTLTLSVVATGDGLMYQWQQLEPELVNWTDIPDSVVSAKTPTLTFIVGMTHTGDKYRCVITDAHGKQMISNECTLTVTEYPLTITTNPIPTVSVDMGDEVSLSVVVEGYELTYQWEVQTSGSTAWADIDGATADTYTFTAALANNGSKYRVRVMDGFKKSVVSTETELSVAEIVGVKIIVKNNYVGTIQNKFDGTITLKPAPTFPVYIYCYFKKDSATSYSSYYPVQMTENNFHLDHSFDGNTIKVRYDENGEQYWSEEIRLGDSSTE